MLRRQEYGESDQVLSRWVGLQDRLRGGQSGGTIVKEPQEVFWGGYHAYFADPDGYYWEVAWGLIFGMTRTDC